MQIENLVVAIDQMPIVHDLSLVVGAGQVHVIMGPNGSGKSSLANALAGHPYYAITSGTFVVDGTDLTTAYPYVRARAGLFLACQQPVILPGVSVLTLLTEAYRAIKNEPITLVAMREKIVEALQQLGLDGSFVDRAVNDGFSGGEKKRLEMVQLLVLKPRIIILDEIDSGLDVDALALVGSCLQKIKQEDPQVRIVIITHYPRLLRYIVPDEVHIMVKGRLVLSGRASLIDQVEAYGYDFTMLKA